MCSIEFLNFDDKICIPLRKMRKQKKKVVDNSDLLYNYNIRITYRKKILKGNQR